MQLFAAPPVPFSGKLAVDGTNFHGHALFSFSIVDGEGTVHWKHASENNATIENFVLNGRYLVLLGGQGMQPLPANLFLENDNLFLRVRVDLLDGQGMRLLEPDQPITSAPYALAAEFARLAEKASVADGVSPGAITAGMIDVELLADLNKTITISDLPEEVVESMNRPITREMLPQDVLGDLNRTVRLQDLSPEVSQSINRSITLSDLDSQVINELNNSIATGSITLDLLSSQVRNDLNRTITKSMLSQEVLNELNATIGPSKLSSDVSNALKPVVVGQPSSVVGVVEQSAVLDVDVDGANLSYQWKKDGVDIAGATGRTLSISDLNASQHEGNYTVVVSNAFGTVTSSVAQIDVNGSLTEGLVGWWKFDETEGTVASDSSGNGNDGNLTNGPTWAEGKIGGALSFDGVDDKVVLPVQSYPTGNHASLSFWAYGGEDLPNPTQVFVSKDAQNIRLFNVHLTWVALSGIESYQVVWDIGSPSGYNRIERSGLIGDFKGSWRHWSFTKDQSSGEMIIFKDGSVFHRVSSMIKPSAQITDIEYFWVGVGYHGLLDDIRIYYRALSAVEVKALYELGGQPVQVSGSGTTTVVNGTVANGSITTNQLSEQILKYLKPEITTQPQAQAVFADTNHTLSVSAEGKYLTYQWKKNGADLAGETNATLTITDANATQHDGNYTVVVSNDFGSVESGFSEVKVNTWKPTDFDNLYIWYDASSLTNVTVVNEYVTSWHDLSGNDRNATRFDQGGPELSPDWNSTTLNNLGGLTFSNAERQRINFVETSFHQKTISLVLNTSAQSGGAIISHKNANRGIGFSSENKISFFGDPAPYGGMSFPQVMNSEFNILTINFENNVSCWLNNHPNGIHLGTEDVTVKKFNQIGALYGGSNSLSGSITEVIITNSVLDSQQRGLLVRYLANKWGLMHKL